MSEDQAYYATDLWQAGERESLEALASGDSRTFDTAADAIAWLLSDDEDR